MSVRLPYGEGYIEADVPDSATVLTPARTPPLLDAMAAVRAAVGQPLAGAPLERIARGAKHACVVVSDITRPVPNAVILPPIFDALAAGGVPADAVTILIATGLHRASRPDERERILGRAIANAYRVVDHDARDASSQALLLRTARGVDVYLNRAYLEADVRVVTGFVEPHLFAGYSGGGKAVLPGIAGAASIVANHDAQMVGHPRATWCATDGNPIFEEMRDVALKSEPSFTVNVTLDEDKRVTGVFAGEMTAAHDAAIGQAGRQAVQEIPHLFDIVVVTNMGYPADLVLYQAVKGMSLAAQACATGGAILLVAECREGLGAPEYARMLRSETTPAALLGRIERAGAPVHDQWQVQVQAMVQARCDVWLHSSLDAATVAAAHLRHAPDVDGTLARLVEGKRSELGREPSVCVIPYGQLTVPALARA